MFEIPACPRCGSAETRSIALSPVAGKWEMYACNHCAYLWRSTESLEGIRTITQEDIKTAVLDFPPPGAGESVGK